MKLPKLCRNRKKNLAFVYQGKKKIYLGKWGTPEAEVAYRDYINYITSPTPKTSPFVSKEASSDSQKDDVFTVADLAEAFFEARRNYYVKNGRQTGQLERFKAALEFPLKFYASTPAKEFGPKKLFYCRHAMENSGRFTRSYINTLVNCLRNVFRFGVASELVPPECVVALAALPPLKRGRTVAREAKPVRPVSRDDVERTLKELSAPVATMVKIQLLTGMRPGEVCAMRRGELSFLDDGTLVYTLESDKTDYRRDPNDKKQIFLGPRAVEELKPYLNRPDDDYLFKPLEAHLDRNQTLGKRSNLPTRKGRTPKVFGDRYITPAYARAITRAAKRAGVKHWTPNQLRHLYATEIRKEFGLEASQIMLGHSRCDVTQIYAERDQKKMIEIAKLKG